jgi:hypothetical protein
MDMKATFISWFFKGKFPSWVYSLVGKRIAAKLELKENKMDEKIAWYKSKTIWTAILGVILGAVQPISSAVGHPIVVPDWVFQLLGGMGLYSLRTATQDIK